MACDSSVSKSFLANFALLLPALGITPFFPKIYRGLSNAQANSGSRTRVRASFFEDLAEFKRPEEREALDFSWMRNFLRKCLLGIFMRFFTPSPFFFFHNSIKIILGISKNKKEDVSFKKYFFEFSKCMF